MVISQKTAPMLSGHNGYETESRMRRDDADGEKSTD